MIANAPSSSRSPVSTDLGVGILLIVIGTVALGAYVIPDAGRFAPLVVGLVLLAIFGATREYGFAVPAGIVTGVGVGVLLTTTFPREGGGLFLLALAGGFVMVWFLGLLAVPARRTPWPFIPGGILAVVGSASLVDVGIAIPYGPAIVAMLLIAVGLSMVRRAPRSR